MSAFFFDISSVAGATPKQKKNAIIRGPAVSPVSATKYYSSSCSVRAGGGAQQRCRGTGRAFPGASKPISALHTVFSGGLPRSSEGSSRIRTRNFLNSHGSGLVGSGRVRSGGFQTLTGRYPARTDPARPARFDPTREIALLFWARCNSSFGVALV